MDGIQHYFEAKIHRIDESLRDAMDRMDGVPGRLKESMSYSLMAGGKRLRPILVLATTEALGGEESRALPFACAVEMIHTYSLIHDDLPAMDDDDTRRGRPTNHKIYGEAMAILAGDALLTKAFGWMARAALDIGLNGEKALRLIEEASLRSGAEGMVGGQVKDILSENRPVTLEDLKGIHRSKTGDLITFSVRLGAVVAGATDRQLEALTGYADRLGLAFQIRDDILNVIGDAEKLGKPVGSDQEKNKATYPALLGLEKSKRWVCDLVEEAKELIRSEPGIAPGRLLEIADYFTRRDK